MDNHSAERDPRRGFSSAERDRVAARQHHLCGHCHADLSGGFEVHHIAAWAHGGRTHVDNAVALCSACHAVADELTPAGVTLRPWQADALTTVLPILHSGSFATVNAAPGAGKTLFTGACFLQLRARGAARRLVVFVPYRHLCDQWMGALASMGVYLDTSTTSERRGRHGLVATYQSLPSKGFVEQIIADCDETPTLVVLDEVHHLGADSRNGSGTWPRWVEQIVGGTSRPRMPVLNLTGTLFRSKLTERISTVRYEESPDGSIETVADYSKTAAELVKDGVLRAVRVLAFDQDFAVHAVDLGAESHPGAAQMRAVDIDKRTRTAVLRGLVHNDAYIDAMMVETFRRLTEAHVALGGRAPLKGLVIADSIAHARQVYGRLGDMPQGDRCFLAVGDDPSADTTIGAFRRSDQPAVLVAVQKVTEGFDVPDVAVLTYLNTWQAPLFINQMIGRAQRRTDIERHLDFPLPATMIIPDEPAIKATFADVLIGSMAMLEIPAELCPVCHKRVCTCPLRPKICRRCGQPWFVCVCLCSGCLLPKPQCTCAWWWPPIDDGRCPSCGEPLDDCTCDLPPPPPPPSREGVTVELLSDPEQSSAMFNGLPIDLLLRDQYKAAAVEQGFSPIHAEAMAAIHDAVKNKNNPWSES